MEKTCFALLHALLLVHSCLANSVTNITSDQSSLLALKAHIEFDTHGVLANNWSTTTSICSWIGVTCSARHKRVTSLDLSNMGLQGTIPPHLGNLSFLIVLDISNNTFRGHLPHELAHLRRLKSMRLGFNKFNGDLPSWLGALTRLQHLNLNSNLFGGTIPPSLANMSQLEELSLSSNLYVQGLIPQEIGQLHNLKLLNLQLNQLRGPIPLTIFNISSLQIIALTNNALSGDLPTDMCHRLPNLEMLYLSRNQLQGQIPSSLYECSKLQILSLSFNEFSGPVPRGIWNLTELHTLILGNINLQGVEIPEDMGNLVNLEILSMGNAGLVGPIPFSIFNITSLKRLQLYRNNLTGVIPLEVGNLQQLETLNFDSNGLTGHIPATMFNISTLQVIALSDNRLTGNIPSVIGETLPNLQNLYLGGNNFSGAILNSISNASKLTLLELSANRFTGSIPCSLGNLRLLQSLNLAGNNFISVESPSQELSFLTCLTNCRYLRKLQLNLNLLNGILPFSIGNLSNSLEFFDISDCGIKGNIPPEIGNLSNLVSLNFDGNNLSGPIPKTIKGLTKLQQLKFEGNEIDGSIPEELCHFPSLGELALSGNRMLGTIPACLGNVTSLRYLHLDSNRLWSTIPLTIWNLKDLLQLSLSSNSFSGDLPQEIGSLKAAIGIDLSMNQFTGDIPSTIGGLQDLISLSLAQNRLQGSIPESFGDMVGLEYLDFSQNNLSGPIPKSLEKLIYLKYFNVSFNRLSGEIPSGGPFANFTILSFMSNEALCGAHWLQFQPCENTSLHRSNNKRLMYILLPITSILVASTILFLCLRSRWRKNKIPIQTESIPTHDRITYHELALATNGFSESNLLGMGSFGSVYKATLANGTVLAAKVFNLQKDVAFKSFETECEILRNIRHRNVTKVISSCSNLDFKALILEYMPNGSLEKWLYSHNYFLDLWKRLDIMIDVACALDYLHHGQFRPVLHCDLKPSNVLLDADMVAHLSDFGIAKFLEQGESNVLTNSLATFGYMAPEYGLEGLVSTRGDVYSFGIMLMETFTRKKPTDDLFSGDLSLKGWVNEALPDAIIRVVDPNLLRPEEEHFTEKVQCISSIMKLALNCSAESPQGRINMENALVALKRIKLQLTNCEQVEAVTKHTQ